MAKKSRSSKQKDRRQDTDRVEYPELEGALHEFQVEPQSTSSNPNTGYSIEDWNSDSFLRSITIPCPSDEEFLQCLPRLLERRENGEIKRPSNNFFLFKGFARIWMEDHHKAVLDDQHSSNMKFMGRLWNTRSPAVKGYWTGRFNFVKDEHFKVYPDWTYQPQRSDKQPKKTKTGRRNQVKRRRSDSTDEHRGNSKRARRSANGNFPTRVNKGTKRARRERHEAYQSDAREGEDVNLGTLSPDYATLSLQHFPPGLSPQMAWNRLSDARSPNYSDFLMAGSQPTSPAGGSFGSGREMTSDYSTPSSLSSFVSLSSFNSPLSQFSMVPTESGSSSASPIPERRRLGAGTRSQTESQSTVVPDYHRHLHDNDVAEAEVPSLLLGEQLDDTPGYTAQAPSESGVFDGMSQSYGSWRQIDPSAIPSGSNVTLGDVAWAAPDPAHYQNLFEGSPAPSTAPMPYSDAYYQYPAPDPTPAQVPMIFGLKPHHHSHQPAPGSFPSSADDFGLVDVAAYPAEDIQPDDPQPQTGDSFDYDAFPYQQLYDAYQWTQP